MAGAGIGKHDVEAELAEAGGVDVLDERIDLLHRPHAVPGAAVLFAMCLHGCAALEASEQAGPGVLALVLAGSVGLAVGLVEDFLDEPPEVLVDNGLPLGLDRLSVLVTEDRLALTGVLG
jgi:hypothetical protein